MPDPTSPFFGVLLGAGLRPLFVLLGAGLRPRLRESWLGFRSEVIEGLLELLFTEGELRQSLLFFGERELDLPFGRAGAVDPGAGFPGSIADHDGVLHHLEPLLE